MSDVFRIARLDLCFEPKPWAFAVERSADIATHFSILRADKPALYNGRVLLLHRLEIDGDILSGGYLETDFASFLAWRDFGFPGAPMWNCFAQGALRGSDSGYLLGVMGEHTANAGKVYFPSGTPDPNDIAGDSVDLDASLAREIFEETGLGPADYVPAPDWTCVRDGPRVALIKVMQLGELAEAVRTRILRNLAEETEPELSDMVIVRDASGLSDRMPDFIRAYFADRWERIS